MMSILHDPTWQFIITTSITVILCIITSLITIWLAVRKPSLPIGYETIDISPIAGDEDIRAIKKKMRIPLNKKTPDQLCLLTLKIWNAGKEPIQLPNPTPLIIRFRKGVKVLGCDDPEIVPDYVEAVPSIEADELKLHLPILMPKQYITVQVLLSEIVMRFPDIYAKVPIMYKIVKANNIRRAKEYQIFGTISLAVFIIYVISFLPNMSQLNANNNFEILFTGFFYAFFGIVLLIWSYLKKKEPPHHTPLPSEILKRKFLEFLQAFPFILIILLFAFVIHQIFGRRILFNCIITFVFLIFPPIIYIATYYPIKWVLTKFKVTYNNLLAIVLSLVLPIVVSIYLSLLIIYVWTQYH